MSFVEIRLGLDELNLELKNIRKLGWGDFTARGAKGFARGAKAEVPVWLMARESGTGILPVKSEDYACIHRQDACATF